MKLVIKSSRKDKKDRYFATLKGFCTILNFENRYNKKWEELKYWTLSKKVFPFTQGDFELSKGEIEREKDLKIEKA